MGRSAKWQYVGAGENQLTLGGLLYPEITGGNLSLGAVSAMAYTGLTAADRWRRVHLRDVCHHGFAGDASGV